MKLKLIINWNTMTWLYVTPFRSTTIEYSASIAVTITVMTAVQRADRCDDRCLIGIICSKWPYRLISYPFKMKKYALYSS
ncbi:hypothetical protein L249_7418 [Ophiocordyceps polyrhachis-furcata BCC 54312]|uniref:Uncharacterized protein n=1 Tax=Ophiocordyceps polyrhachis-furcata BCC 54312 TaxID=1330021 RepID=A0A367LB01_9HYPO|nr:hypothetical protein L249_7418 [Ophiocordyceps polyrhachis-furcata BCC 54312]